MEAGFYGVAAVGSLIGSPGLSGGISGTRLASIDGVVKYSSHVAPFTVVNEYICGALAMAAGLPVPPGTIAKLDSGEFVYVMLRFGLDGEKPPAANTSAMVRWKPLLCAGIAVFDCWTLSSDRHSRNYAYIADQAISVFDHGHALFGTSTDYLTKMRNRAVWAGPIIGELNSAQDLLRWSQRLRALPDDLIDEYCDTPRRLGILDRVQAKTAADVLISRKLQLTHYIETSHSSFPRIADWGITS